MINNRKTDRIRHDDIKHPGRMTNVEISKIPLNLVYEWVNTGKWKFKDFNKFMISLEEAKGQT